jgi:hypothetical protein
MAINKVDLTVTQLINDLNEGLTWFKKDDLGYGSIENKYGATAPQIMAIKKQEVASISSESTEAADIFANL